LNIEREKGPHDIGWRIRSMDTVSVSSCLLEVVTEQPGRGWYNYDPQATVEAAMSLAAKSMFPAIADLAMDLMEQGSPVQAAGWNIEMIDNPKADQIHFNMTREDQPGCWQFCAAFDRKLSEQGKINRQAINDKNAGEDPVEVLKRTLNRTDTDEDTFCATAENFRAPQRGDVLKSVSATAMSVRPDGRSGPPERIEAFDSAGVLGPFDPEVVWWPGIALHVRKSLIWDDEPINASGEVGRSDGFLGPEALRALSAILLELKKDHLVTQELEALTNYGFWSARDGRAILLEEVGLAAVCEARGFLNDSVMQVLANVSDMAAEKSISRVMTDLRTLNTRLPELGFDDPEQTYDCNDMDDFMHVTRDGDVVTLHLRTQNGEYRLSHDEVAGTLSVQDSVKTRNLGTFNVEQLEEGTWRAQAAEAGDVTYCSQNVRSFNDAIHCASSAACCLAEHYPIKEEDPSP